MLAGPNGNDMEFSDVAKGAYEMWERLRTTNNW
jgi:hypothetical protein